MSRPEGVTEPRKRGYGRWAWAAGTLLAGALLMFCYLRVAGATQVNSDGAGLVLEARSILHGNLLLHGWWATDVSFYTTELPEYTVVTAFAGVRPEVVHICSALTYTLLVLLAAYVARGRARGPAGLARALLAAGIMLAPQPTGPTQVLLGSPDHVGTAVPVLLLLLLLDWAAGSEGRRRGWYVPVAAGVLLAWSIIGDPLIEVVGVAPLFLACLIRAARLTRERWPSSPVPRPAARPGRVATAWAAARSAAGYELGLAAASVIAVPVAAWANWMMVQLDGFRTGAPYYGLLSPHQVLHGVPVAVRSVLALFGADPVSVHDDGSKAFALLHLAGVAVVFAAVLVALWRLARPGKRPADLVTDVIVLAIVANLAAFLVGVPKPNVYAAHEIGPVLALGAALAGRLFGQAVADRPGRLSRRWHRGLIGAATAFLACYAVLLGLAAAHQQAPPRNVALAQWLTDHHLRSGLGPYWEGSSITVDTGGAVNVMAVTLGPHQLLMPQRWQNYTRLSDAAPANFIITSPAEPVHRQNVIKTFGQPPHTYHVGPYTVYVWPGNLIPQLARAKLRLWRPLG